ncbi:MAG: hypothetical protein JSS97_02325 [Actinobacteria bacterium]|nr:hypothetical protein [Actinomycetota bacterium]
MKKALNALFGRGRDIDEYREFRRNEFRGGGRRDTLADAYFLSHTGVPLRAMEGIRQPEPTTGEFPLGR